MKKPTCILLYKGCHKVKKKRKKRQKSGKDNVFGKKSGNFK